MPLIDYVPAEECKNENVWHACHKCGKCGRVFENGIMVDDGGTTVKEELEQEGQDDASLY